MRRNPKRTGDTGRVKILIADAHPVARLGLRAIIEAQAGWRVCGEAEDEDEAVRLAAKTRPDVVLVDMFSIARSLEVVRRIRQHYPAAQILLLSAGESILLAGEAVRAGARGYITKKDDAQRLREGIQALLSGESCFSAHVVSILLGQQCGIKRDPRQPFITMLSPGEFRTFELLSQNLGTRDIASQLGVNVETVNTYLRRIKRKLGLDTGHALQREAMLWGKELKPRGSVVVTTNGSASSDGHKAVPHRALSRVRPVTEHDNIIYLNAQCTRRRDSRATLLAAGGQGTAAAPAGFTRALRIRRLAQSAPGSLSF